jgi:hypothetical protein
VEDSQSSSLYQPLDLNDPDCPSTSPFRSGHHDAWWLEVISSREPTTASEEGEGIGALHIYPY